MQITKQQFQESAKLEGTLVAFRCKDISVEVTNPYHKGGRAWHAFNRGVSYGRYCCGLRENKFRVDFADVFALTDFDKLPRKLQFKIVKIQESVRIGVSLDLALSRIWEAA